MTVLAIDASDFPTAVTSGSLADISVVNKFGLNEALVKDVGVDIWDGAAANWLPPTTPESHNLVSVSVNDEGTLVSTGTVTDGTRDTLTDTAADFTGDGVAVGDLLVNDTNNSHGTISAITATTLTTTAPITTGTRNIGSSFPRAGQTYRVITSAGTGASAISIFGLDADYNNASEYLILNGTTNVPTVNVYSTIFRMIVLNAGSHGGNFGDVSATSPASLPAATVTAQINANRNQTLMAVYTIPADHIGILTHYYAAMANKTTGTVDMVLWAQPPGEPNQIKNYQTVMATGTSSFHSNPKFGITFSEKTTIKVRATASAVSLAASAGFDILLVKIR